MLAVLALGFSVLVTVVEFDLEDDITVRHHDKYPDHRNSVKNNNNNMNGKKKHLGQHQSKTPKSMTLPSSQSTGSKRRTSVNGKEIL